MRDSCRRINGLERAHVRLAGHPRRRAPGHSQYQFTLWNPEFDALYAWVPKCVEPHEANPGSSTSPTTASRAGCSSTSPSTATRPRGSACASQTSTARSTMPSRSGRSRPSTRSATSIASCSRSTRAAARPIRPENIYVPRPAAARRCRSSAVIRVEENTRRWSSTIRGRSRPSPQLQSRAGEHARRGAPRRSTRRWPRSRLPDPSAASSAGDARAFAEQAAQQPLLILAALIAVYIVLGVLYESLAHPLTIISTLPSAGLGALIALRSPAWSCR